MADCTVLTAAGTGAIALIRVSGADATQVVQRVLRDTAGNPPTAFQPSRVRYGVIVDDGEPIDDVIVAVSDDASFIDLCAHGGIRVVERVLAALERAGATFCGRGGTTPWRAKTTIEREALVAMQMAKTWRAAEFTAYQWKRLSPHVASIATLCEHDPEQAVAVLTEAIGRYEKARLLLDGVKLVFAGPPNSGKSTLLNRVVGRFASVVSPAAGTTRDWVAVELDVSGVPVALFDTPGGHPADDALEREAILASVDVLSVANLVAVVLDGADKLPDDVAPFAGDRLGSDRVLVVANKSDLPAAWESDDLSGAGLDPAGGILRLSALTGAGVDGLFPAALDRLGLGTAGGPQEALFTERQILAARSALSAIRAGRAVDAAEKLHLELIGLPGDSCGSVGL